MPRGIATRNRIKQAALELFVAKGVLGTSVRDIAALAEIAEGGLYRHYASKEDLAWKLFSENYAALAKELHDLAKAKGDFASRLGAMIQRFCRFFDEEPLMFRFLLLTQHQELPKLRAKSQSPVQALHKLVVDAKKQGEIAVEDVDLVTAQILGLILQPATFMIYGLLAPGMRRVEAETVAACLKVVTASSPYQRKSSSPGLTRGSTSTAKLLPTDPRPSLNKGGPGDDGDKMRVRGSK